MSRSTDLNLLNISDPEPTVADLKKKYHELAAVWHPDHGGDVANFAELSAAYERLLTEAEKPRPCAACAGKGYTTIGAGFVPLRVRCDVCRGSGLI
jgi:DnaJ-class molecular chaperone